MSIKEQAHINVISAELLGSVTVAAPSLHTEDGVKAFLAVMDTFGFAVVTDVLTKEQVAVAESLFDDDLRSIVDLPDAEKNTKPCFLPNTGESVARRWSDKHPLGRYNPSFASDYGVPHGRCAWYCRQNDEVRHLFEVLFNGNKELCVGLDNVFFDSILEDHATPDSAIEEKLWPHADQSLHAAGGDQPCYQGILYLWPSSTLGSTTVVWPRSHKDAYVKMMSGERTYKNHYSPLPDSIQSDFIAGAVRVIIPCGGMILFSSKLIHQGWNTGPRLAVPICMEPKLFRTTEALERKVTACLEGLPTTHWASLGLLHGSCNKERGGTEDFPLFFNCHKWLSNAEGVIDPVITALL